MSIIVAEWFVLHFGSTYNYCASDCSIESVLKMLLAVNNFHKSWGGKLYQFHVTEIIYFVLHLACVKYVHAHQYNNVLLHCHILPTNVIDGFLKMKTNL